MKISGISQTSGRLRRALLGTLFALFLIAALEGGARLLRPSPTDAPSGAEWMEPSPELGWRNKPGFRGTVFLRERAFDAEHGLFTVDTPAATAEGRGGRRLILLLGDSRTFGNGVPVEHTYGEILDRRLPGTEVINLAVPGHTSFQGRTALEIYASRFRPDVVVFAYGLNDRRYVLHPDHVDSEDHFRRLAFRSRLDRFAGALALVDLLKGRGVVEERAEERPLDLATVLPRVPPEDFRRNLEAVARDCAQRGMSLIFLLLNDNPAESRDLARGVRRLRDGRLATAERRLRAAVALNNRFSDAARLYLADLYGRTGRGQEAAAVRISPRTFRSVTGGYPIVFHGDYREITRQVAARHGVPVVDAGSVIDRRPEWYYDFCHFGGEGHRTIARLLAAELARTDARERPGLTPGG